MDNETRDQLDLLWGGQAIGDYLGLNRRQAYWLLEQGRLPARQVGGRWTASREALRRHVLGEEAA